MLPAAQGLPGQPAWPEEVIALPGLGISIFKLGSSV